MITPSTRRRIIQARGARLRPAQVMERVLDMNDVRLSRGGVPLEIAEVNDDYVESASRRCRSERDQVSLRHAQDLVLFEPIYGLKSKLQAVCAFAERAPCLDFGENKCSVRILRDDVEFTEATVSPVSFENPEALLAQMLRG